MSPSPREGFYCVIHFSFDGKRIYVTLGCGATVLHSGGYLTTIEDEELDRQSLWALQTLEQAGQDVTRFNAYSIDLANNAPVPLSFERATMLAEEFSPDSLNEEEFLNSLFDAVSLLRYVYEASSTGGHRRMSDLEVAAVEQTLRPKSTTFSTRQGFGLTRAERDAVESRAMEATKDKLESLGFSVTDTSANNPFDFLAERGVEKIKVEVKGTTSAVADGVLMTANEVKLHQSERGSTALSIVSAIKFKSRGDNAEAEGGSLELMLPWNIDEWLAEPTAFIVRRPA